MKELKKVNMFCSICEENHDVSLIEEERETMVKGEKIKYKDYESLYTCLISLGVLISLFLVNLTTKSMVLILLIWMGLMCLIKLKKADFYHDRKNKMWCLRLFILFTFLTTGLLTGINLYYESSVQTIIIGFFFLINGILDVIDPITVYLMELNK